MKNIITITEIIESLSLILRKLDRKSSIYVLFDKILKDVINQSNLLKTENAKIDFGVFGELNFPYKNFGAIDSLDLFGLDELILFNYYFKNKNVYKNVADLGANIGLHSIIMSRCGWNVDSYEPDPIHFKILNENLKLNNINNVNAILKAVSNSNDDKEFVRVKGNTTSSHIKGSKTPYGELETFIVKVERIKTVMEKADFIKMDVEGIEDLIICSTVKSDWIATDMMLEVGNKKNANSIFNHLQLLGVNCFSQKNNWNLVQNLNHVPFSYKEGSLFISLKEKINI